MIYLYSKNNCPKCEDAITVLRRKGIVFKVVKIDEDSESREFLIKAGHKAVPQFYNEEWTYLGDYNAFIKPFLK